MRIKNPTPEEVKKFALMAAESQIRSLFTVDEEFKLINLGIIDDQHPDYLEYREQITQILADYKIQKGKTNE